MKTMKEINQLISEGKLQYHHSAASRGYCSVGEQPAREYKGLYGEGYTHFKNGWRGSRTQYCTITYYIFTK